MGKWRSVLRAGHWVHFDGGEHEVVAIAGTSVRLRSSDGEHMIVLASHLMAAPDFEVVDATRPPEVTPFGLLDALPAPVLTAANEWERHILEATNGTGPDGAVLPEYDPATRNQTERFRAKVEELTAAGRPIGFRTLQRMWARLGPSHRRRGQEDLPSNHPLPGYDSRAGCGSNSEYTVTWSVTRSRANGPSLRNFLRGNNLTLAPGLRSLAPREPLFLRHLMH
ncbi:hypothetical protein [Nocardia brasiliensis]